MRSEICGPEWPTIRDGGANIRISNSTSEVECNTPQLCVRVIVEILTE